MGTLILLLISGFLLIHSVLLLGGNYKGLYFAQYSRARSVYAELPWGIGFLWFAIATIPQLADISLYLSYIGVGFIFLGLAFTLFQPSFLKPTWLKWLERKHGDILPILKQEAHQVGLAIWEKHVDKQGLDVWVAEVRRKNGLPEKPPPAEP